MGSLIGPLIGLIAVMIPVIAMLISHQQKMAEIYAAQAREARVGGELESQISELADLVRSQALALDDLRGEIARLQRDPVPALDERINS